MEDNGFDVELDWSWGTNYRFRETIRFHVDTLDRIDAEVEYAVRRITRRYTFDCSDVSRPMHPALGGLTITPVAKRRYESTERFNVLMERERAHTERLIREGRLYVNNNYDMTPAPLESPATVDAVDPVGEKVTG